VGNIGRTKPSTVDDAVNLASQDAVAAVLYVLSLAVLYRFQWKYGVLVMVICGAVAGQFLFV
jgi:hypothetical protein